MPTSRRSCPLLQRLDHDLETHAAGALHQHQVPGHDLAADQGLFGPGCGLAGVRERRGSGAMVSASVDQGTGAGSDPANLEASVRSFSPDLAMQGLALGSELEHVTENRPSSFGG